MALGLGFFLGLWFLLKRGRLKMKDNSVLGCLSMGFEHFVAYSSGPRVQWRVYLKAHGRYGGTVPPK